MGKSYTMAGSSKDLSILITAAEVGKDNTEQMLEFEAQGSREKSTAKRWVSTYKRLLSSLRGLKVGRGGFSIQLTKLECELLLDGLTTEWENQSDREHEGPKWAKIVADLARLKSLFERTLKGGHKHNPCGCARGSCSCRRRNPGALTWRKAGRGPHRGDWISNRVTQPGRGGRRGLYVVSYAPGDEYWVATFFHPGGNEHFAYQGDTAKEARDSMDLYHSSRGNMLAH